MPSPHDLGRTTSAQSMAPSLSAQIAVAIVVGISVGLLDAALVVFRLAGAQGAFQYVPARIWIVAPLIWVMLAILAGVAIAAVTRKWAGVSAGVAVVIVFLAIRFRSHPALLAASISAVGVASALAASRIRRWLARPRRSIAAVTLGLLLAATIAVAMPGVDASARSMAAGGADPNVIVVFLDTVRYDAVFDEQGQVHPQLETLTRLRAESRVFTRAYATSSWTLPSHLSAVTGLAAHELGVGFDWQVYGRPEQTLAERFRERGYRTAAVISNSFLNAGSGFGRGFDIFQQAQAALDICRTAPGLVAERHWPWFAAAVCNWTASDVTERALGLMDDADGPFFLTLNYMDAHDPYYVERSCGGESGYHAAIECLDRRLAPIVDWRSRRRPTVLALLSDHGELFGELGLERHGTSLHVKLLHVPMMIRPVTPSEVRPHADPISIASLPNLLGVGPPTAPPDAPVLSLLHPPGAESRPSEWSAIDETWHLIVRERGADALYHLPTDPMEEHDRIATAPSHCAVARLRSAIEATRHSPRPDAGRFRSLGYIH